MGINIDKIKERLKKSEETGGGDSQFWKPSEGSQNIRILPTADGDPFKDFHFHYLTLTGPDGKERRETVLCPNRNFGDDCPICDFATQLWKEGDEEDKNLAKKLFARQRFFSAVIVRGEEDKLARVYGYSKTAYEKLLSLVLNPEYGDITDVDEGTDFTCTYTKGKPGSFPTTDLTPSRKTSPLCDDKEQQKAILESIPDFSGLFERRSAEQVQEVLDKLLNTNEEEPDVVHGKSDSDDGDDLVASALQELSA